MTGSDIRYLEKIILYSGSPTLPPDCRTMRFHISQTAGFIHIFERDDYRDVVHTLAVPEEVRRYLQFRERSLIDLAKTKTIVLEADIVAAYLSDQTIPSTSPHKALERLVDDAHQADLGPIMNRLADHIQNPESNGNYTRILLSLPSFQDRLGVWPRKDWTSPSNRP